MDPRRGEVRDQRKNKGWWSCVPVGHSAFVQKWLADKEESHQQFLTRIPAVQDAQCAWLLLLMCAGPRAHHILGNLPPSEVSQFAPNHDTSLRACQCARWREEGWQIVCPRCMPEHHKFARSFSRNWRDHHPEPSVCGKPRMQPRCWQAKAWRSRIGPDLRCSSSVRRSQSIRKWESGSTFGSFHASVARDTVYAPCVHLPPLSTDHQASRTSQRGPCASHHFTCLPTSQETTFTSEEFRTLLLVRLHLPLHVDERVCKCG